MTRLSILCVTLLVLSALSLVSAQYRARQLFIDLDRARATARKLDVQWRTLQLDQTNYSKNSLIEATAERDLRMQRATPRRTQIIALPGRTVTNRDLRPVAMPDGAAATPSVTRETP
jgi:cell division protein FtsL